MPERASQSRAGRYDLPLPTLDEPHPHVSLAAVIREEQRCLMEQWTPIVTALLHDLARNTWGEDAYVIIPTVSDHACTWTAACQRGGDIVNYQVILDLMHAALHTQRRAPNSPVVQPVSFTVSGRDDFKVEPTEEALRRAMQQARRSGPKWGGLTSEEEAVLEKTGYRPGEYESRNWALVAVYVVDIAVGCASVGFGLGSHILANHNWIVISGLLLVLLGVVGLTVTEAGTKLQRLHAAQKWAAIVALLPGGIAIGGIGIFLTIVGAFVQTDIPHRIGKMGRDIADMF